MLDKPQDIVSGNLLMETMCTVQIYQNIIEEKKGRVHLTLFSPRQFKY